MPGSGIASTRRTQIASGLRVLALGLVSSFGLLLAGCLPSVGSGSTAGRPLPSGSYGDIQIGSTVRSAIVGATPSRNIFHEYTVPVPMGIERVDIELDGLGRDLDLAVTIGGPFVSFDEAYFVDDSYATFHWASVPSTALASTDRIVYVYVLNLVIDQPADYVIAVTGVGEPVAESPAVDPRSIQLAAQIRDVVAREMGGTAYDCFEDFPCFLMTTGQADAQRWVESTLASFSDVVPVDPRWDVGEGGFAVRAYKLAMETGDTHVFDVYVDGGIATGQGTVVAFSVLWTVDRSGATTYYD